MLSYCPVKTIESCCKSYHFALSKHSFYKLKAILTHQGRSADSGHYISHVLVKNQWLRYDDEKVKEIEQEDIDNLIGSADWHCSFVLLYEAI